MLANRNEVRNFTAVSEIKDEPIATFNATYNDSTTQLIFSKSIADTAKYKDNIDAIESDYSEFQNDVMNKIG